jgi:hypothetical protein
MSDGKKSSTLAQIAAQEARRLHDGLPTVEEEQRLSEQEASEPFVDEDAGLFEYVKNTFILKGGSVRFTIHKDGAFRGTEVWPLSWEKLREKYGTGTFKVIARNMKTGEFIRQQTEIVEGEGKSLPEDQGGTEGAVPGGSSDLMTMLTLMQRQDERRAQEAREERLREEAHRREERERDEQRRKEERDSRNSLLTTLLGALPAVLPLLKPKEDTGSLKILELQLQHQQEQSRAVMERLERAFAAPAKQEDPFKLIQMLQDAEDRGWKKREKISEEIDAKAAQRAEEMMEASGSGGGDGDESSLSMILKSVGPALGPAIGALLSRGQPQVAVPAPQFAAEPVDVPSQPAIPARPPRPVVAKAPSKDEHDQKIVLDTVLPFLGETLTRMAQQQAVDPKASAKECLELLKPKGFKQERVLQLFTKTTLFQLLRQYQIPTEADPWFNDFYAALETPEAPLPPPRQRPGVKPLTTKGQTPGKRAAPSSSEATDVQDARPPREPAPAEVLPPEESKPRPKSLRVKPDILADAGLGDGPGGTARGSSTSLQPTAS